MNDELGGPWEQRIARARHLADRYPAAAEILNFYAALADYQKSLLARGARGDGARAAAESFDDLLDRDQVLAEAHEFLSWLTRVAPAPLAEAAAGMSCVDTEEWRRLLDARLGGDFDFLPEQGMFVVEALLQPFAERAAGALRNSRATAAESAVANQHCPFCGDRPVVGVLQEEGHGARRRLLCALCLTEWDYFRVLCPACGEDRFDALSVYLAEQCAHVRIEACESCHRYIKTIDSTKDGFAVPLVDDLATVSLDLWARDQGYVRLRSNLLRI